MKRTTLLLASIACLTLCATSAHAAVKYFDINGTVAASGATAGGTYIWSTSSVTGTNWNSDSAGGAGTISAWASNLVDAAVFSAGTDASICTILALQSRSCPYQHRKRSASVCMPSIVGQLTIAGKYPSPVFATTEQHHVKAIATTVIMHRVDLCPVSSWS